MVLKYDVEVDNSVIAQGLEKVTNQIFKLLPQREEGADWQTPLANLMIDVTGMCHLVIDHQTELFFLLCKMEALATLTKEEDFLQFRKVIFECLGLIAGIKKCL